MARELPHEVFFTRAVGGLFLPDRKALGVLAVRALTEAAELTAAENANRLRLKRTDSQLNPGRLNLGSGSMFNMRPNIRFGPDLLLFVAGSTIMRAVIEVKLHAPPNSLLLDTCEKAGRIIADPVAEDIHASLRSANNGPLREDEVWQIDAYRGWRWFDGLKDEGVLVETDPAVTQYVLLTLSGFAAHEIFEGAVAPSAWVPVKILTFLRLLNEIADRVAVEGGLNKDEQDAIAALTFLGFAADAGTKAARPGEWVQAG